MHDDQNHDEHERGGDAHNTHGDSDGNVEADTASGGPPEPPDPPTVGDSAGARDATRSEDDGEVPPEHPSGG